MSELIILRGQDPKLARQDEVDNAIYDLLNVIVPLDKHVNLSHIGEVRDEILDILARYYGVSVEELYPSLEEE